jgi:hypothetical protein
MTNSQHNTPVDALRTALNDVLAAGNRLADCVSPAYVDGPFDEFVSAHWDAEDALLPIADRETQRRILQRRAKLPLDVTADATALGFDPAEFA